MPEIDRPQPQFSTVPSAVLPGLSVVSWEGAQWNDILYFPKNYQVGLIRRGNGTFASASGTQAATEGDFFFVHPGRIHRGKPDPRSGWRVETLCLQTELVAALVGFQPGGLRRLPLFSRMVVSASPATEPLRRSFEAAFGQIGSDLAAEGARDAALAQLRTLFEGLDGLFPSAYQTEPHHRAVGAAREYLETHFREPFSLDRLADEACLSKYHLLRVFRQQTGVTPQAYQIHLRLNEARRLLFERKSLTTVALEVGFADQAHFTNAFKKYADGFSPKTLAKTAISFNFRE